MSAARSFGFVVGAYRWTTLPFLSTRNSEGTRGWKGAGASDDVRNRIKFCQDAPNSLVKFHLTVDEQCVVGSQRASQSMHACNQRNLTRRHRSCNSLPEVPNNPLFCDLRYLNTSLVLLPLTSDLASMVNETP